MLVVVMRKPFTVYENLSQKGFVISSKVGSWRPMSKHHQCWKSKAVTDFMENVSFPIHEAKQHLHENKKRNSGSLLDFHLT